MDEKSGHSKDCHCSDRRSFLLKFSAAATAFGGGMVPTKGTYADELTQRQRDSLTPQQILEAMKNGNARFRSGERKDRNYLREQQASASGQHPKAALLSCIDSRAPAEVIMDLGIGDIFNTRVAGNIGSADILGSLEFACKTAGTRVLLVMGHTSCGAIKGAIDNVELGNLTGLLAKIKPAVLATSYSGERSSKNFDFVDAVARTNVGMTIAGIRKHSPVLVDLESSGAIKIAGAMYDLKTGAVDFFP